MPTEVVLASRNAGKLKEMQALLAPLGWELRLVTDFSNEEPEESAPTFVENALIKARHASKVSGGLPAIADDSGIEVDALDGKPGVHSARYAAKGAGDRANNRKLMGALEGLAEQDRGAQFVCVMVFLRHPEDPTPLIAQGAWRGRILHTPQGEQGFGYDPLFWVPGHDCSAAQLDPALKNRISHRAQASAELLDMLRD